MGSDALKFFLPLPKRVLSPNWRGHWTASAAAKKEARATAKKEALRVLADAGIRPPKWEKARFFAVYLNDRAQFPDPDNFIASLKAYLDGLADAGVVANDRGLWPERPVFRVVDRMPRIEITIEPEPNETPCQTLLID